MQIRLEESNFTVFMFVAVLNRGVGGSTLNARYLALFASKDIIYLGDVTMNCPMMLLIICILKQKAANTRHKTTANIDVKGLHRYK